MRMKKKTWILTFESTTQAMAAEKYAMEQNLPGRLIPIPREITAGCGHFLEGSAGGKRRDSYGTGESRLSLGRGVYTGIVEKPERQLFGSFTSQDSDC